MSLSNTDFLDYAISLNPGLLHVYHQGHLLDLSGHGIVSTIVGTPAWARSKQGHEIQSRGAGNLDLGDPASCQATTHLAVLAFGDFTRLEANGRIVAKRSGAAAATCDYDLFLANTPAISLFDGVTTSTLNVDYRGAHSIAARVADGAVPSFFVDGVLVGVGGAVFDVDDDGNALYTLAREGGADRLQAPLGALLVVVDTAVTDEQISDLHRLYFEDARGVPTAPARTISLPKRDMNDVLLYLAGPKDAAGDVVDYSGNGLDSAVTGRVGEEREHVSGARVQHVHGTGQGVVTVPASGLLTGHTGQTYSGLVRVDGDGEAGAGRIFSSDIGGAVRAELLTRNVNDLRFSRLFADGLADWDVAARPGNGLPYHLVVRHDGDPTHLPTGLVNGRAMLFAVSTGRAGALTSDVGADTKLGNRDALNRSFYGTIGSMKLHGEVLTDEQARVEYLQHAVRGIELAPRRAYPVTLANISGGRVGPWDRVTGTWSYQDDGTRRQLVNVAAGACVTSSDQAYGAQYFRFKKVGAGNVLEVMLSASTRAARSDAAQNGYALRVLANESVALDRITGGAVAHTVFATAVDYVALNTEYEVINSCAYNGYRVSWIRGGAFAAWTAIGSGTDNTHTTSRFMVADIDAADELSDVVTYPFGDTLDPSAGDLPGDEAQEGPRFTNDQSTLHNTTIIVACPSGGVTIAWGDGDYSAVLCDGVTNTYIHTYAATGQYTIRILGSLDLITGLRCYGQSWISGDIASLSGLTSLVALYLYNTSISGDIASLSGLTSLAYLRFYNTSVSGDISALNPLTSLVHLLFYNTTVSGDISALSPLTLLTAIYLYNTLVSGDIASLTPLTVLGVVNLSDTMVSGDISAVSSLTALTYLHLYNTLISGDIASLSGLTSLAYLHLYNTSISGDISALNPLTALLQLRIYSTLISTYTSTPLPAWAGLAIQMDALGLSTGDLDDFLIDLADGVGAGVTVDCLTGNGPRSGASDAAVAAIIAAGGAVT